MALEADWNGHTIKVTGDWTYRWFYLAPVYELYIDDDFVDRIGGPRVHPHLEAIVEDENGQTHHIEAELLSVFGYRPKCSISVEGDMLSSGRVRVTNFLNPFLILFILMATAVMVYLGPDVVRQYWPF